MDSLSKKLSMETEKSSYDYINDCINIVRNEFKERISSTKMRSVFERSVIGQMLYNSQLNIEKSMMSILEDSIEPSESRLSYHFIKSCLKVINLEFGRLRNDMTNLGSEEQNILGDLITSTEIELEKSIKRKLDEVEHPPLTKEQLIEQQEIDIKIEEIKKAKDGQHS